MSRQWAYIGGGLLWVIYFVFVYRYSTNVPFMDDYDVYLGSILNFRQAPGAWEKLQVLLAQHNEHRPLLPRLIALLVTGITGNCNMQVLILLGNLALFFTWLVLIKHIPFKNTWVYACVCWGMIFLLTGLQSIENTFWATGALQNYLSVFLSVCVLSALIQKKYMAGLVYTLLAILCSAAGFLLVPFVIGMAVWKRKYIISVFIICVFILVLYLYFHTYQTPPHTYMFQHSAYTSMAYKVQYFFSFIGSGFLLKGKSLSWAYVWGVFLFIVSIIQMVKSRRIDAWTLLGIWVIINALAAAYSRGNMGPEQALTGRYRVYSILLLVVCGVRMIEHVPAFRKLAAMAFLAISKGSAAVQVKYLYPVVVDNKKYLDYSMAVFIGAQNPAFLIYPVPALAGDRLIKSAEAHIYTPY